MNYSIAAANAASRSTSRTKRPLTRLVVRAHLMAESVSAAPHEVAGPGAGPATHCSDDSGQFRACSFLADAQPSPVRDVGGRSLAPVRCLPEPGERRAAVTAEVNAADRDLATWEPLSPVPA